MKRLHLSLALVGLLVGQSSASAFLFKPSSLPPNRHWLTFKRDGREVGVKLNLKRLRVLGEKDAERAQELMHTINLLPQVNNPLLVVNLLKRATANLGWAIKEALPAEGEDRLSQSEQDTLWVEGHKRKEIERIVFGVYDDVLNSLLSNTKLLQLLAITDPYLNDYQSMLEIRIEAIDSAWSDNTELTKLASRYKLDTTLEEDELEQAIRETLTSINPAWHEQLTISDWHVLEKKPWKSASLFTDKYSKALYYQAVATKILVDGGAVELTDTAKIHYVASDLIKIFYYRSLKKSLEYEEEAL